METLVFSETIFYHEQLWKELIKLDILCIMILIPKSSPIPNFPSGSGDIGKVGGGN